MHGTHMNERTPVQPAEVTHVFVTTFTADQALLLAARRRRALVSTLRRPLSLA